MISICTSVPNQKKKYNQIVCKKENKKKQHRNIDNNKPFDAQWKFTGKFIR